MYIVEMLIRFQLDRQMEWDYLLLLVDVITLSSLYWLKVQCTLMHMRLRKLDLCLHTFQLPLLIRIALPPTHCVIFK